MKRKPGKRGSAAKPAATAAKPLRELWERLSDPDDRSRLTAMVSSPLQVVPGVSLPPDLEEACRFFAREETRALVDQLQCPPCHRVDELLEEYEQAFDPLDLEDVHVAEIQYAVKRAVRSGFNLALLRYADELKHVPEAAAMLEANRKNAKKGGAARSKEAEPRRQQARRLDRELRKTVKKKYLRVQRIAAEMKVDTRTVERYLSPKK
jgi:hypothetical protein